MSASARLAQAKVSLAALSFVAPLFLASGGVHDGAAFVTVSGTGGADERVFLEPESTAFETAARFCATKDVGQVYSKYGQDPMEDTVCAIPLTQELRSEMAKLCKV